MPRNGELSVTPHLPADWNEATIHKLPFGSGQVDVHLRREGEALMVSVSGAAAGSIHLASHTPGARVEHGVLRVPLPALEVAVSHGLPEFGSETRQMKVLAEEYGPRSLRLTLSGPHSSTQVLSLRVNAPGARVRAENASIGALSAGLASMTVSFPASQPSEPQSGPYVQQIVTITW